MQASARGRPLAPKKDTSSPSHPVHNTECMLLPPPSIILCLVGSEALQRKRGVEVDRMKGRTRARVHAHRGSGRDVAATHGEADVGTRCDDP